MGRAGWIAAVVMMAMAATTAAQQPAGLPPVLDRYVTDVVRLGASERERLLAGHPVTRLLDADESKEVAVFGAVWIDAPRSAYVARVTDIEAFERGGAFRVTKKISDPPRLEDFDALELPAEDLRALPRCRVGRCDVKLGEAALERFQREVDWNAPNHADTANALMRRIAHEYVTNYLAGGNTRLAVYRDSDRPTFVAGEFESMVNAMPAIASYMPDFRRYLLEYPAVNLPGATSFLYWQETTFGLKPTIRISHLTVRESDTETVVGSKMIYASHYFWTGLELRVLLPDPARGEGFWFVTVNRSRSDGLSGFTGFFVRRRVRSEVQNASLASLQMTRSLLEQSGYERASSVSR